MDWSKAKNILIIAFIITNTFLAYVLFVVDSNKHDLSTDNDFLTDIVKLLSEKDIKLETDIPKEIPSLPVISIEYEKYKPEVVADRFLEKYVEEEEKNGVITYKNGNEILRLENNNKKIVYKNYFLQQKGVKKENILLKEALDKAKSFIEEKKFKTDDFKLGYAKEKDGIYKIEYNKVLKDIVIEETYMILEVSNQGVISFERYWVDSIEKSNNMISVSSTSKALLRILTREEYYGKTIKEISVCYYFKPTVYEKSDRFRDARGGKAIPTWRFVFEDGSKAFLEDS
ncbi:regulatory protein in low GC content Gram positives [Gottschalkia acidurici 9a]|uniref:Regulatory protein in low GC content Gram positives n=1 Tax=Gottschalkia acidurici (strain ATCC 7906 / DSM 604 / BCRC 14475 / CIP 104303 / KCTC 5404 / NCIMB 10678 / 9a) TaxID=1128398 RepID=K0B1E4_GOTA9|nr:two-component system regulatory protein YycI [Gottschalkia acidurici]AFS79823.1 regulatory protein in low GC content Gram positives [Gottschalkia acidurici 9a]